MFRQRTDPFDRNVHGHEYTVQMPTFMCNWTSFWIYFQVFYLLAVMAVLMLTTLVFFFENIDLSNEELYEEYVNKRLEMY